MHRVSNQINIQAATSKKRQICYLNEQKKIFFFVLNLLKCRFESSFLNKKKHREIPTGVSVQLKDVGGQRVQEAK